MTQLLKNWIRHGDSKLLPPFTRNRVPSMKSRFIGAACLTLLAACAQQPVEPRSVEEQAEVEVSAPEESKAPDLPKQELTEKLLFEFLVGEIAAQRGDLPVATSAYLDLAKRTRDPRVAQRATEVALQGRYLDAALQAAKLWLELDPDSVQARQTNAGLLVTAGRLQEARVHLEALIAGDEKNVGAAFLHLNNLLARNTDRAAVLTLVRDLAKPYPKLAEAHFAVAQSALAAGEEELALAEAKQALALRPDWEMAALLQGQVLTRQSNQAAAAFLRDYVRRYPKAREARLAYARALVGDRQYEEARKEFQRLVTDSSGNPEMLMAIGLLSLQLKDLDAAETSFKAVLDSDYRDLDAARYYMGQVQEDRKRYDEADLWYRSVGRGDNYLPAQTKVAQMLARQGRLDEARRHLQEVQVQNNQQRVQLIMAEAQLLREAGQYQEAYELLGRALDKLPNSPDLLYDHAMAAEKLDRLDVLEANLRKLIAIKPDHAHAYNALGYTLADRNMRLEEAKELVGKALQLAPEDPFIVDSMGWVQYRSGNLKEALDYLRRAYRMRPDPEIAAHLGEVLWAQGERDEAKRIWQGSLKEHPDNESLLNTVKRFTP